MYIKIKVPKELNSITSYKPEDEVDPADADMSKSGVESIWSAVEDLYRTGIHPAISLCLRRRGKIVLKRAIGHARGNGPGEGSDIEKIPATPDTPFCLFSASKAVTAMLIHLLVERGKINLMDPVSYYIPEFISYGKEDIAIYHILTHRGGIHSLPRNIDPEIVFDHDAFTKMICRSKYVSHGGQRIAYHAITGGFILGEIVRRVTGKDIRELLVETLKKPLGFRYFNYGTYNEDRNKVAANYYTGWPVMFPISIHIKRALGASWKDIVRISGKTPFTAFSIVGMHFPALS